MAIIQKTNFPTGTSTTATVLYNWLKQFENDLFSVSINDNDVNIDIDNGAITLTFTRNYYFGDPYFYLKYKVGSGNVIDVFNMSCPLDFILVYSDSLFYCNLIGDGHNNRAGFIYEKTTNKNLYGVFGGSSGDFYDIAEFNLIDIDSSTPYKHNAVLNYADSLGYLDYLNYDILFNGSIKAEIDNNFIACSELTPNTIITFNANNYYVIGKNSLIILD